MENRQQAIMTRNSGLNAYFGMNEASYTGDPAMQAIVDKFIIDTAKAVLSGDAAAANNTGYSADKLTEKLFVSNLAAVLCAKCQVKLDLLGNKAVSQALNGAMSFYFTAADALCGTRLMNVYNVMNKNIALMTADYLTAAQLATFLTRINTFTTMSGSTTAVNTNMPVLTKQFDTDLKVASDDVVVVKMLVKGYKTTNNVFYNGVMKACKVPAVNVHHTTVSINITDTETTGVLAGVKGTLTKSKELPVSNVGGVMLYSTVPAGMATGTFAKVGYITKVMSIDIKRGKFNSYAVGLTPGIMTPAMQAEVTAQVDLAIEIDKAEKAAKAKLKKEAKIAAALKAETEAIAAEQIVATEETPVVVPPVV